MCWWVNLNTEKLRPLRPQVGWDRKKILLKSGCLYFIKWALVSDFFIKMSYDLMWKFIDFARVSLKELYVQLIYRYLIGIAIRIRIGSFQKNNDFGCSRSIFLNCLGISPFDCRRKSCTLRLLKLPLQIHIWMGTYLRGMLISLDKVRTNLQTRWINSKQDKEYNEPRDILFSEN